VRQQEYHNQDDGQGKPGYGILQVIVAQLGLRHAANGQIVRVGLSIGLHDRCR